MADSITPNNKGFIDYFMRENFAPGGRWSEPQRTLMLEYAMMKIDQLLPGQTRIKTSCSAK